MFSTTQLNVETSFFIFYLCVFFKKFCFVNTSKTSQAYSFAFLHIESAFFEGPLHHFVGKYVWALFL